MRNRSAYIDYKALVNRFGLPPLVEGENLDDFEKCIHQYTVLFGDEDGYHWALIWDHAIAGSRLMRYTRMKVELGASSLPRVLHPFTKPFASTWTTYIDGWATMPGDQQFENEEEMVDAIYRAHAEGKEVSWTLNCLIAQARSDLARLSRALRQYYSGQAQENIIDGEWKEVE
jgi:hypothetical protein